MKLEIAIRFLGGLAAAMVGWQLGEALIDALTVEALSGDYQVIYLFVIALASFGIGFIATPYIIIRPFNWTRRKVTQMPAADVIAVALGLMIGLLIAALLSLPLSMLPWELGRFLPIVASVVLGYFGAIVMYHHRKEIFGLVGVGRDGGRGKAPEPMRVLVDTSAIIDGRISDVSRTGFITGTMVIPRFVLGELQQIADSPDAIRRNRGRRGLEMLNKLQKESAVPIEISDADVENLHDVDSKLIRLARNMRAAIVTNDYNLNRVAELQGVKVLNINELANAVKSVVFPGEEMVVRIIQEGKEFGQGVAYLDDGTMVVVENGRRHINSDVDIVVTRVLQTVAGRMIFAHPRGPERN
jgi:uncharacterized protein YacL